MGNYERSSSFFRFVLSFFAFFVLRFAFLFLLLGVAVRLLIGVEGKLIDGRVLRATPVLNFAPSISDPSPKMTHQKPPKHHRNRPKMKDREEIVENKGNEQQLVEIEQKSTNIDENMSTFLRKGRKSSGIPPEIRKSFWKMGKSS